MRKEAKNRLKLNRETLKRLSPDNLKRAQGGRDGSGGEGGICTFGNLDSCISDKSTKDTSWLQCPA